MSGTSSTHPESILIVRLGAMGDVLHAMPAVAALRKACPEARIGWAIEHRWSELLVSQGASEARAGDRPLVDAVHRVDTRAWRKNLLSVRTWREIGRAAGVVRAEKYRVAIDVQGAVKSSLVARLSGAAEVFGFAHPRESVAKLWYTSQVSATAAHVIDQNLQLASAVVRNPLAAETFDLPHSAESESWCEQFTKENNLNRFALLNPGSGWGAKCWPSQRYAEVAKRLHAVGMKSLINFGPGEEELARLVADASAGAALAVSCTLAQLIAVTRRAALFVGGDTGPMHLAAALKVPTIALFGPTDPARNGPYWQPSVVLRNEQSITSYKHVAQPDPGLNAIDVEAVLNAATQLLGVPIG